MLKRMMILIAALAVMVGLGVASSAQATDIEGEMVFRWEGFDNFDQNGDADDGTGWSMLRTRVGFGGELDDNATYMLMLENYRTLGDPDNDENEIYQATFTVHNFLFDDFDVTFGRMPVAYGRERVIGKEDWSMDPSERMIFEGYHGRYSFDSGWFDYFNFKTCETYGDKYVPVGDLGRGDSNVTGFYMHYDATETFFFEPYAILASTENWNDPDVDNDKVFTFGGLMDYVHEGLHFYGEVVGQSGTTYAAAVDVTKNYIELEQDVSTLAYYAGLFYDFDATAEPFIGFEYNYASGEDGETAEMDAFGSLAGSSRDYLGIMNIVPWTDVVALRFAGGFSPVDGLDLTADFFMFDRDQEVNEETKIGTELDVALDYMLNEDVDLHGGVGMFSFDEASASVGKTMSYDGYVEPGDSMMFAWFGASVAF